MRAEAGEDRCFFFLEIRFFSKKGKRHFLTLCDETTRARSGVKTPFSSFVKKSVVVVVVVVVVTAFGGGL